MSALWALTCAGPRLRKSSKVARASFAKVGYPVIPVQKGSQLKSILEEVPVPEGQACPQYTGKNTGKKGRGIVVGASLRYESHAAQWPEERACAGTAGRLPDTRNTEIGGCAGAVCKGSGKGGDDRTPDAREVKSELGKARTNANEFPDTDAVRETGYTGRRECIIPEGFQDNGGNSLK
ncbi:hypothetical protein C8R45DRAFT_932068 [Mycena sanguinolenta]|nr:hypothetical protein C8R45DRAFT_932068 [Mycena sanguinolenta]